jgi:exopolysaccharide biosynthesis polyprenyl glycosylphosphotransferase
MSTVARPSVAPKRHPWKSIPSGWLNGNNSRKKEIERWDTARRVLIDVLLVGASSVAAYFLRFSGFGNFNGPSFFSHSLALQPPMTQGQVTGAYLGFLLVYLALLILAAYSQKLYRIDLARPWSEEVLLLTRAVLIATVVLTAFIYLSGITTVSRMIVGSTAFCSALTLSGWRIGQRYILRRRLSRGVGVRHALIIGAGEMGIMLADYLQQNRSLGYRVLGFLDSDRCGDPRILGVPEDLPRAARQFFIDEIFITIPSDLALAKQLALGAMELNLGVKVVPELYYGLAWGCPLDFVGDIPVRVLHPEPIPAAGLFLKRMTDVVCSALLLFLLSPLLLLIALAIEIDSPGPIFYRAYRVGRKGRKFLCYKFRTMVPNADALKDKLRHLNERQGPFFKISKDPRLTRLGSFLRRYSLDELPQLWNVLKGEMSLVGPRPHPLDDVENYTLEHFRRLEVTPGITGLWQIEARHDPSFEKTMTLDNKYIEQWSYLLDLQILLRTIPAVFMYPGR